MTQTIEETGLVPAEKSQEIVPSPFQPATRAPAPAPTAVTVPAPRTGVPRLPAELEPRPIEKAAIILTAIGPEFASDILSGLDEYDMERFTAALGALGRVKQEVLEAVIIEFLELLTIGPELSGGHRAARELLSGLVDDKEIDRILNGRVDLAGKPVWERMEEAPVKNLAAYLQGNHPQTVAIILTELKAEKAAIVLEEMDTEFAQSIILRLSRVPTVDDDVAKVIKKALERDFLSVLHSNMSQRRPADLIAGLMNNISSDVRDRFLSFLEEKDAPLAADVQRTMFTFEDIRDRVYPRDVAAILREMEDEVLLAGLKFGEDQDSPTVPFLLDNLPRRLSERYREELGDHDPVPPKDGEAAQIELTKLIQAQAKSGLITLIDKEPA